MTLTQCTEGVKQKKAVTADFTCVRIPVTPTEYIVRPAPLELEYYIYCQGFNLAGHLNIQFVLACT